MQLSDKITIVVPCKNEENYICNLLTHLRYQMIGNTRIIIADCSTDNTRKVIQATKGSLNVEIIDGGPVSFAKNRGAELVTTPYILFIDSDVRFFNVNTIRDAVDELESNNLDLVGLYVKCYDDDIRAQLGFMLFNAVNNIMKYKVPFAIGAFMLTRKEQFDKK
jgi:glycosyltransferase involved in cell wall biosynthesis